MEGEKRSVRIEMTVEQLLEIRKKRQSFKNKDQQGSTKLLFLNVDGWEKRVLEDMRMEETMQKLFGEDPARHLNDLGTGVDEYRSYMEVSPKTTASSSAINEHVKSIDDQKIIIVVPGKPATEEVKPRKECLIDKALCEEIDKEVSSIVISDSEDDNNNNNRQATTVVASGVAKVNCNCERRGKKMRFRPMPQRQPFSTHRKIVRAVDNNDQPSSIMTSSDQRSPRDGDENRDRTRSNGAKMAGGDGRCAAIGALRGAEKWRAIQTCADEESDGETGGNGAEIVAHLARVEEITRPDYCKSIHPDSEFRCSGRDLSKCANIKTVAEANGEKHKSKDSSPDRKAAVINKIFRIPKIKRTAQETIQKEIVINVGPNLRLNSRNTGRMTKIIEAIPMKVKRRMGRPKTSTSEQKSERNSDEGKSNENEGCVSKCASVEEEEKASKTTEKKRRNKEKSAGRTWKASTTVKSKHEGTKTHRRTMEKKEESQSRKMASKSAKTDLNKHKKKLEKDMEYCKENVRIDKKQSGKVDTTTQKTKTNVLQNKEEEERRHFNHSKKSGRRNENASKSTKSSSTSTLRLERTSNQSLPNKARELPVKTMEKCATFDGEKRRFASTTDEKTAKRQSKKTTKRSSTSTDRLEERAHQSLQIERRQPAVITTANCAISNEENQTFAPTTTISKKTTKRSSTSTDPLEKRPNQSLQTKRRKSPVITTAKCAISDEGNQTFATTPKISKKPTKRSSTSSDRLEERPKQSLQTERRKSVVITMENCAASDKDQTCTPTTTICKKPTKRSSTSTDPLEKRPNQNLQTQRRKSPATTLEKCAISDKEDQTCAPTTTISKQPTKRSSTSTDQTRPNRNLYTETTKSPIITICTTSDEEEETFAPTTRIRRNPTISCSRSTVVELEKTTNETPSIYTKESPAFKTAEKCSTSDKDQTFVSTIRNSGKSRQKKEQKMATPAKKNTNNRKRKCEPSPIDKHETTVKIIRMSNPSENWNTITTTTTTKTSTNNTPNNNNNLVPCACNSTKDIINCYLLAAAFGVSQNADNSAIITELTGLLGKKPCSCCTNQQMPSATPSETFQNNNHELPDNVGKNPCCCSTKNQTPSATASESPIEILEMNHQMTLPDNLAKNPGSSAKNQRPSATPRQCPSEISEINNHEMELPDTCSSTNIQTLSATPSGTSENNQQEMGLPVNLSKNPESSTKNQTSSATPSALSEINNQAMDLTGTLARNSRSSECENQDQEMPPEESTSSLIEIDHLPTGEQVVQTTPSHVSEATSESHHNQAMEEDPVSTSEPHSISSNRQQDTELPSSSSILREYLIVDGCSNAYSRDPRMRSVFRGNNYPPTPCDRSITSMASPSNRAQDEELPSSSSSSPREQFLVGSSSDSNWQNIRDPRLRNYFRGQSNPPKPYERAGNPANGAGRHSTLNAMRRMSSNMFGPIRMPTNGLRMIVIDGSNVAMGHSKGKCFSVEGLKICIDYFLSRGHVVKAFVPHHRLRRDATSNPPMLHTLKRQDLLVVTPSRDVDGALIASYDDSDNYRDLRHLNDHCAYTIKYRLLIPTWVDDLIMFPPDPLGRYGVTLDEFLQYDPSPSIPSNGINQY